MAPCCCCCCGCFFSCLVPDNPVRATTSRFLPRRGFLLYRILVAAYFLFWSIFWPFVEGVDDAHEFVTYWAWYMATIYALVSMYTPFKFSTPISSAGPVRGTHATGHHDAGAQSLSDGSRTLLGFQIFAWNIAFVGSLVVPTVFWTVLADGSPLSTTDVNAHALIALVMAVDQLLVATKFERKQMWASFAFSVTYVVFNAIWFLTAPEEDRVIYSVMDWGESVPNSLLTSAIIIFVLVPVGGLIHYFVFRVREFIYETCCGGGGQSHAYDIEKGTAVPAIVSR